jgi:endo-beta-N-acetylglucosaminidase D
VPKLGKENIFKSGKKNDSLHEISNDNGVGIAKFVKSRNLILKSTIFQHCDIHNFTWVSFDGKTQSNSPYFDRQETAFNCT